MQVVNLVRRPAGHIASNSRDVGLAAFDLWLKDGVTLYGLSLVGLKDDGGIVVILCGQPLRGKTAVFFDASATKRIIAQIEEQLSASFVV